METYLYAVPAAGILALIVTYFRAQWINKQETGDEKMREIARRIQLGAMSFLRAEYTVLLGFVAVVAVVLAFTADSKISHWFVGIAFVIGAFCSALAGYIGMRVATNSNVRTTQAARTSLRRAMDVSFAGGAVMGIGVVSLAVIGLGVLFIITLALYNPELVHGDNLHKVLNVITGFSLGAETIALFARVGGGIFTKAADVGADLVGKVEAGIPEDDPRNPAVIADNVGDNVGDVAGMGADLFGSYVSTIIATMVLGVSHSMSGGPLGGLGTVVLPLLIAGMGVLLSMVATFFVKVRENGNPQTALNIGNLVALVLTAVGSYFLINGLLPATIIDNAAKGAMMQSIQIYYAVLIGLGVGISISLITEYYTAMNRGPVRKIVQQSGTGPATNVIAGLSVGMMSTMIPVIILAVGIVASFSVAGLYGVAIAASGMMATTGMQLAIDAFGPIADNAGGIAEMTGQPKEVRERTDVLDAVGNTTAAVGKGFAIASAALTSLALFAAYMEMTGLTVIDISNARVLGGLFIGGMIPFVFSSLAISAVGSAANAMVEEVRRQFREIKGLLEGKEGAVADYDRCIKISTNAAIRQMILPGLLALLVPVIIGFGFGAAELGGALAGVTVSGVLMALFQSNAGGSWDNAKKSFEKGVKINNKTYQKGSEPHKAAVVGDTVGDPFKDTSGPSMNILIKLMSIVALVIAPALSTREAPKTAQPQVEPNQTHTKAYQAPKAARPAAEEVATLDMLKK
ncbi:MAG: sodium-translocating pyrophosphatase [Bacteroidetes bacterium]|jgi:K(+)-stimulated pyrophosphate-energized sodium pump|nr:sodium-translocating pyrophosphatase [Bacteroidota bacterium]